MNLLENYENDLVKCTRGKNSVQLSKPITLVDVRRVGLLSGLGTLLLLTAGSRSFLPGFLRTLLEQEESGRQSSKARTFFSGALPAGALPAVVGFFSAALGGILLDLTVRFKWVRKRLQSVGGDGCYVVASAAERLGCR
jgi:hypothetical protein